MPKMKTFFPLLRPWSSGGLSCRHATTTCELGVRGTLVTITPFLKRQFQSTFTSMSTSTWSASKVVRLSKSRVIKEIQMQPTRYLRTYQPLSSFRIREAFDSSGEDRANANDELSKAEQVIKKNKTVSSIIIASIVGAGLATGYYFFREKEELSLLLPVEGIGKLLLLSEKELAKRISEDPLWVLPPADREEMDAYCREHPIKGKIAKEFLTTLFSEMQKLGLNVFRLCKENKEVMEALGKPILINISDLGTEEGKDKKRGEKYGFEFQIIGPLGKGTVNFDLDEKDSFKYVEVSLDGGDSQRTTHVLSTSNEQTSGEVDVDSLCSFVDDLKNYSVRIKYFVYALTVFNLCGIVYLIRGFF